MPFGTGERDRELEVDGAVASREQFAGLRETKEKGAAPEDEQGPREVEAMPVRRKKLGGHHAHRGSRAHP